MTQFLERRSFVKSANRANEDAKGVLMVLDGDNFAPISDNWGPVAGELAIQALENAIAGCVRADDQVSYMDADRFLVFIHAVEICEANAIAERIRQTVQDVAFEPEKGVRHPLTVSIGAVVAAPKQDAERLIELAETCLGHAKRNGRNSVVMKTYFRAA